MSDSVNDNDGTTAVQDGASGGQDGVTTTTTDTASDKDKNFRALEEARDKEREKSGRLLDATVNTLAKSVGVDTSKGVGKLLVKEYKSTLGDEVPSDEHFKAFLAANDFEVGKQTTDQERMMGALQSQSDALRNSGTAPEPENVDDLIKKAENEGKWTAAMDLKLGKQLGLIQ